MIRSILLGDVSPHHCLHQTGLSCCLKSSCDVEMPRLIFFLLVNSLLFTATFLKDARLNKRLTWYLDPKASFAQSVYKDVCNYVGDH